VSPLLLELGPGQTMNMFSKLSRVCAIILTNFTFDWMVFHCICYLNAVYSVVPVLVLYCCFLPQSSGETGPTESKWVKRGFFFGELVLIHGFLTSFHNLKITKKFKKRSYSN
jgi:hypothetical protein